MPKPLRLAYVCASQAPSKSLDENWAKLGGNLDKHQSCHIYNYNHFRWNNKISVLEDCICGTPFQVFQDTCSIRERTICSKHAGSDELGRPVVLDIFAIAPLVGRTLYFGMLGPQRPYVPRELVSLVVHHSGNIELNTV